MFLQEKPLLEYIYVPGHLCYTKWKIVCVYMCVSLCKWISEWVSEWVSETGRQTDRQTEREYEKEQWVGIWYIAKCLTFEYSIFWRNWLQNCWWTHLRSGIGCLLTRFLFVSFPVGYQLAVKFFCFLWFASWKQLGEVVAIHTLRDGDAVDVITRHHRKQRLKPQLEYT